MIHILQVFTLQGIISLFNTLFFHMPGKIYYYLVPTKKTLTLFLHPSKVSGYIIRIISIIN